MRGTIDLLKKEMQQRILLLDGAMGTMLQRYNLTEADFRGSAFNNWDRELKGNNECLNLTRPDVVKAIYNAYIEAGSDIIETNSFCANSISQNEYGCGEYAGQMAYQAARLASECAEAAERIVWVAGSVGPTGKSLSLAPNVSRPGERDVDFDQMVSAFKTQISALVRGGVDVILAETCFDALNTKAIIYALSEVAPQMPVIISVAVSDRSGRSLTGQTLEAFYLSVKHANLLAFGMNCSFGASDLRPLIESMGSWLDCPLSFYPNAGLPNEMGQYDETPQVMSEAVAKIAGQGLLNIAGGCCGTSPEHISALKTALQGIAPRAIKPACNLTEPILTVCGLECMTIDHRNNLTNIGERTNVAGSRKFARLISQGQYDEAMSVAAGQIEGGADIIDINMDDAMLDSTLQMQTFLRHISNDPAVARAALMIDASHFETILTGLKNAQGKCIVNSISLKEGEQAFIEKARQIKAFGAAVVVMAFDEEGQAVTYQRKTEICQRAYTLLTEKAGFNPNDIIFDVNVLSVGTGIAEHARYGIDFIDAVRWIKGNLPGALTSGGISNLSFAFRGNETVRQAMHSVFLYHASKAGLDMSIVNPSMLQVYDDIEPNLLKAVEDVVLNRTETATDALIELAQKIMEAKTANAGVSEQQMATTQEEQTLTVSERLTAALVKGASATLETDVKEALNELGTPVAVIEGPLMAGMEKVGQLFGSGKMFLPQVVKSARIMRQAVDILQPYMSAHTDESANAGAKPEVVIATVKGDVHDIGKNITAIVLSCNGFSVTDLGVMVPEEQILDKAQETGAVAVVASGLITPSLTRMEELCRKMAQRGMEIPLFIGGATTSALHTAVKLAPLYNHVFHGSDASATSVMAKRYLINQEEFEASAHQEQEKLRKLYAESHSSEKKAVVSKTSETAFPLESYLCQSVFPDLPARKLTIDEVMPYFDWRMFYVTWGIKPSAQETADALRLKADAEKVLVQAKISGSLNIQVAAKFLECVSKADDIVATDGSVWPMFRQVGDKGLSLADYVVPEESGKRSQMGMFAVSVHKKHSRVVCDCGLCNTMEYESVLERSVRLCLAEATSEWLTAWVKSFLPKERTDIKISKPAAGYASLPDHTLKRRILPLLPNSDSLQISFTESYAMIPDASICGLVFAHAEAGYPEVRGLSEQAVKKYAERAGLTPEEAQQFLSHIIA